jgi:predicted TIM-barrel fold metal-dependent hydrolase
MSAGQFHSLGSTARAAKGKLPGLSCDAQFHVFGPANKYTIRPNAAYSMPLATLGVALEMHKILGFQRGMIVQSTVYGADNSCLIDALKIAGSNYRGTAIIDDSIVDADLDRMHASGVRAARFNFNRRLNLMPTESSFEKAVARIKERGWHVKINTTPNTFVGLMPLLKRLTVDFVLDHMGGRDLPPSSTVDVVPLLLELLDLENCWIMLSNGDRRSVKGRPWDDSVALAQELISKSPDRMIWGSDWPHPMVSINEELKDDGELLDLAVRYADGDEGILRKIFVENPARLFGFPH